MASTEQAVTRELILPAIRLDVPPRPSAQQVAALADRSADAWTDTPTDWLLQQVVRLDVAALLQARFVQAGSSRGDREPLPTDPAEVTLAQVATLFRPHVDLASQALQLAVLESANAGIPAAADPVREGLRRLGITGRAPLQLVALGLDKVPSRARHDFWEGAKASPAITAVVAGLMAETKRRDVTDLDRSQLARVDALALTGGRLTPLIFGGRPREGATWLPATVSIARRSGRTPEPDARRGGPDSGVEVALWASGWTEVFDTALGAVAAAMREIDQGNRPKGGRTGLTETLAQRLAAAKGRTLADVLDSLRAIDPLALEIFDPQVQTSSVAVAVPVIEDDRVVQLWLPSSALAGPLVTGAVDLFLGDGVDYRSPASRPAGPAGRSGARPSGPQPERGQQPDRGQQRSGSSRRRKPGGPGRSGPPATPSTPGDPSPASAPDAPAAAPLAPPTVEAAPAPAPAPPAPTGGDSEAV